MIKDVSFLLPTNRDIQYASRTIESINNVKTDLKYEICLYSKDRIDLPNVTWFEEKECKGPCNAYNEMVKNINTRYVVAFSDDFIVLDNVFNAISFLDSGFFDDKQFKLLTLSPGVQDIANIPIYGTSWCQGETTDYHVLPYTTLRFPVVCTDLIRKKFNGYLFNPKFIYHCMDMWLGFFVGINGEPGIQLPIINSILKIPPPNGWSCDCGLELIEKESGNICPSCNKSYDELRADIRPYIHLHSSKDTKHDCIVYHSLVKDYLFGNLKEYA